MESMIQMMQGLAQDMWLKMEAEAKNATQLELNQQKKRAKELAAAHRKLEREWQHAKVELEGVTERLSKTIS